MKDLIIIGAGPMGICAGIEARKHHLDTLIIEKGTLVNSIYHFPQQMTFFSTSEKLEIGNVPFISHFEKPKRFEALEYYRRVVNHWNLEIQYQEKALDIKKIDGFFELNTERQTYQAKNIILATGFYDQPKKMNIPGEDLPKLAHYFDNPYAYTGQKVAVIGAANSATQVALELYYKGIDTTLIVRKGEIKPTVKYWIKPNIENRIAEGEIKAYFNTQVQEIRPKSLLLKTPQGEIEIDNDYVFAMTGYKPDYEWIKKIGIDILEDDAATPYYSEETHESNIPGIYLAGVVCGGKNTSRFFIENSMEHAEKIINHILEK